MNIKSNGRFARVLLGVSSLALGLSGCAGGGGGTDGESSFVTGSNPEDQRRADASASTPSSGGARPDDVDSGRRTDVAAPSDDDHSNDSDDASAPSDESVAELDAAVDDVRGPDTNSAAPDVSDTASDASPAAIGDEDEDPDEVPTSADLVDAGAATAFEPTDSPGPKEPDIETDKEPGVDVEPTECSLICEALASACAAELEPCVSACQVYGANSATCGQQAQWQAVLDCCSEASWETCSAPNFDACQLGACGELRPEGATSGCTDTALCGNGVNDGVEHCDDGNDIDDDQCTNKCTYPLCGDGILHLAQYEECDDGNDIDTDTCSKCKKAHCGDGFVQSPELCDDGNSDDTDACPNYCGLEDLCGDGYYQGAEECDDGNEINDDQCTAQCKYPRCGDGILQLMNTETCEDSNTAEGDGCDSQCHLE